jgi:hypothetical protein
MSDRRIAETRRDGAPRGHPLAVARGRRALIALASLLVGWLVGSAVAFGFEGLMVGGRSDSTEMLTFALLIGLFAGGAWAVSVLPIALYAPPRGRFFSPVAAPVIGGVCGVLLLVLQVWIFFDPPPWELVSGGGNAGSVYLLILAGIVGATTWSVYTASIRRSMRRGARSA